MPVTGPGTSCISIKRTKANKASLNIAITILKGKLENIILLDKLSFRMAV